MMGVNTIIGSITARFALHAFGLIDYGLFAVLGCVISYIGIFNASMLMNVIYPILSVILALLLLFVLIIVICHLTKSKRIRLCSMLN